MNKLIDGINRQRLADDLWTLVNIPSPTRHEREAALAYGEMLKAAGALVEIDETLPDSPAVIGRLKGNRPGKTLQLAGHIDNIPVEHPAPERGRDTISGRGSADMKSGLCGILEVVRLLAEAGCDFPGEILVTAYGLHEAPHGDSRALYNLIERGVVGDAAIVFEGFEGMAVVCGKGQSIWNLYLDQRDEACHELRRKPKSDLLLTTAMSLAAAVRQENEALALTEHSYPLLGPETVFIGQLHYGDFYNRVPKSCSLQGTWRWHPDHSFEQAQAALHTVVGRVDIPGNITVREAWTFVGESFEVDPGEPIVQSLKAAFKLLYGKDMEEEGTAGVADTSRLVPEAKVPTVLIGFDGATAHADFEFVRLERVEENCRLALATVLEFFTGQERK